MRYFAAFADDSFFRLHKISDARAFFQMGTWTNAREWSDRIAAIETAFEDHRMRFDGDAIAEDSVVQDAAGSNLAVGAEFCFAEQLHTGLDDGVFSGGDIGPNEHGLRQLNADARIHQFVPFAFTKDGVHLGKVGAGIATEHFAGVRRDLRKNRIAPGSHNRNRVGQVNFTVFVFRLHLRERGPEFVRGKTINTGVDFVQLALLRRQL